MTTTLCPEGTNSSLHGQGTNNTCQPAPPGRYATIGSLQARDCTAGTFNDAGGRGSCTICAAGTFQEHEAQTACNQCRVGFICVPGSVIELPTTCDSGSFYNVTLEACTDCPDGFWCPGGLPEAQPRPCSNVVCPDNLYRQGQCTAVRSCSANAWT